ncbi:MAG: phosphatase PAP2 family protein, partial [Chloroflexota bacterium]
MFEALENGIGLDIILWLQENRTAWMETLSIILDQLGYDLGYVALFGIIFWTINKRRGVRMVFALVVIALLTFFFKDLLGRPRPFVASELVMPVFETSGFGLPSGHTSLAVMIWGYVALWVRKGWVWGLAITYMILQGLGRMVAGVHYPQDVFFGALLAIITLALYYPLATQWETLWHKQPFLSQIAISLAIPMIITGIVLSVPLDVDQIEAYLTVLGLAMGAGIGISVEAQIVNFTPHENRSRQAITIVMGIVLVLAVLFGLSPLFDAISETGTTAYVLRLVRYGTAGLVAIAIVPYLAVQLGL